MQFADSSKIYPRTRDKETVYLKNVISDPSISVGDFSMYNDFVNDPKDFEKKQCTISLSNQSRQTCDWKILFYCLWCKIHLQ